MSQAAAGAAPGAAVLLAAGAAVLIWGGTPIATRIAVETIDPAMVGMLRTLLAALLAPFLMLALRLPTPAGDGTRPLLAFAGLCAFVLFPVLFSIGIGYTTASHAALILALQPVFTALTAHAVERHWPSRRWALGAAFAAAGAFALVHFRIGIAEGTAESWIGDLLILAAGFLASIGYVGGGRAARRLPAVGVTLWGLAIGGLALLPLFAWRAGGIDWSAGTLSSWSAVAYLAFAVSSLGYLLWYWALARGGIARIGTLQFLQPVASLVLAAILLGETMTLPLAACAALVLAGTIYAHRG
ncbi:MAG TPA: DMT family transporter [Alphaproteobacteria bacterium]|jgi:drug/metabolite transporter (DMT)-like permease